MDGEVDPVTDPGHPRASIRRNVMRRSGKSSNQINTLPVQVLDTHENMRDGDSVPRNIFRGLSKPRRGGKAGLQPANGSQQRQRNNADMQQQSHVPTNGSKKAAKQIQSGAQAKVYSNKNKKNLDNKEIKIKKICINAEQLKKIAQGDSHDVLANLMESKDAFIEVLRSPIEKNDIFFLIVLCLAKVCQSPFEKLKLNLLMESCNSNFIVNLECYLMKLPYQKAKDANTMYWKEPDVFWKSLLAFVECVLTTSPTLALNKCRSLLRVTFIACLDILKEHHSFVLRDDDSTKLKKLQERMANLEKVKGGGQHIIERNDGPAPENFRELSVIPTRKDLLQQEALIHPNIVDGPYQDVEHYLDVQFRLLREDCFGPLRDGLGQYMKDPKKRQYDHIRVFRNVKFVGPYVSHTKMGSFVQLDLKTNENFKRIDWKNSKNLIFGSLVLFIKDDCETFKAGIILDREMKYLVKGLIPVSLVDIIEFNENLYNKEDSYTMIESQVYFEPYYHVLRALQDPSFPEHIAMKQYIVDVNPVPKHPLYLKPNTEYDIILIGDGPILFDPKLINTECRELLKGLKKNAESIKKFVVLQNETWPNIDELQFNESQLEAYKLALTHEFAVIQGPPGTGKTHVGIKIAKTLFQNLIEDIGGCLILVICYTNHALDQFLEALLKVTNSIVRIGGQSRNEAMAPINLGNVRRQIGTKLVCFYQQRMELESTVTQFQKAMVELDVLMNGVMKSSKLSDISEIQLLQNFYISTNTTKEDPLFKWLFMNFKDYDTNIDSSLLLEEDVTSDVYADLEKETRERTGVQLDDMDFNKFDTKGYRAVISCFSLKDINTKLRELTVQLKKCPVLMDQNIIRSEIQFLNYTKKLFEDMAQHRLRRIHVEITANTNFHSFSLKERWILYFMWIQERVLKVKDEIGKLQAKVDIATKEYKEVRMLLDLQILRSRHIVGMTTSGAARMRTLLETLAPPIVIVEEAAQVLESHIISSLTKGCQHLILMGDHQQLRPSASHIQLARHYDFEVSLFERMIKNGIHSQRLSVQHRMRPEIAALISPHIYKDLQNHSSVCEFPDVKGMVKNLYFLSHNHKEELVAKTMSRKNQKEADLVLALANYLIQQGYTPDDVTILSAYKGQWFYLKTESCKYKYLNGVKITSVDNYQGEESKIILLSLVRNNEGNKIGFLGTDNRICVALSRAKEGFYIFGNIENLTVSSELWRNIANTLESGESIGKSITLRCQNHPKYLTTVSKVEDFKHVPEGGCTERCDFLLGECGHQCLLFCHGYDQEHNTDKTKCTRQCERILCTLDHVCPKKCAIKCGPCNVNIKKTLPCGHDRDLPCHQADNPAVQCFTLVEVTLPDCGHKVQKTCYLDIKEVLCTAKCKNRLEKCGHDCLLFCHVKEDPDHKMNTCQKPCEKPKKGCTAGPEKGRGAHKCDKKCHEICDDCNVQVMKEIPGCKHKIMIMCSQKPTNKLCQNKCERTMSCGHLCKGICGEKCDPSQCTEPSSRKVDSPCGHQVSVPCNIAALPREALVLAKLVAACAAPCGAELACGHACRGTCARCCAGRLHVPCAQPCRQINVCGHKCEKPCNQICPPCQKQCEFRCSHSRCNQMCGAPCTPCQKRCGQQRCKHGACQQRCGDPCDRAACSEPCPRRLRCGHNCLGLCGEPCPRVCFKCNNGDISSADSKFIVLQDCGHVMELEKMDTLMYDNIGTVEIRKCPSSSCRKRIINTRRYKDSVKKIFKEKINPIWMNIYGNEDKMEVQKKDLLTKAKQFEAKYFDVLKADRSFNAVFLKLNADSKKIITKLQLEVGFICLDILDMIAGCYQTYLKSNVTKLKTEMGIQMRMLIQVFAYKLKAGMMLEVSEQQQKDLSFEIKRMNSIVQLSKLARYIDSTHPEIKKHYNAALSDVFSYTVFDERKTMESLTNLQNALKASSVVLVKLEREIIVKAIGLKARHNI